MLTPYLRGATWWAKGRVEYNGLPITGYIRESTGASSKAGAAQWISLRQQAEERRFLLGDAHAEQTFTFNDAILLYKAGPDMAKYLIPIAQKIGQMPVKVITPKLIRDLGPELYPKNSTDSWRRWVIAPARAVINNAHHLGKCGYLRVDGYPKTDRLKQDKARGKRSRVKKVPGSWEWLLKFRQHASRRHSAIALFMFATGARIGQAVAMTPDHLKLDDGKAIIPGAKGHDDREVTLPPELVAELLALAPRVPRGWDTRLKRNRRVFGWASKDGPRKGWMRACKLAGILYLPPHSAGRHGFGQEMRVRQGVDKKAVERFGGWSPEGDMVDRTYTHEEHTDDKILEAFRTGRVQAEKSTGLKLAESVG
jgi:integrase